MPVSTASKNIIEKMSSRSGKAAVITSTPYKDELKRNIEKRKLPSTSAIKRKISDSKPSQQKKIKPAQQKKKLSVAKEKRNKRKSVSWCSSTSDSAPEPDYQDSDDEVENFEEDAICIFCQNPFSEDVGGEEWVKCQGCFKWAHVECAGCERSQYICDFCASK